MFKVYSIPYWTVEVLPFSTLVSVKFVPVKVLPTEVFRVPLTKTWILSFVNELESKYLSVTLNLTVDVLAGAFIVELIFSTNGSTTSTTFESVDTEPPRILTPDVNVVALFPFPVILSSILFAGIATVTTPL